MGGKSKLGMGHTFVQHESDGRGMSTRLCRPRMVSRAILALKSEPDISKSPLAEPCGLFTIWLPVSTVTRRCCGNAAPRSKALLRR